MSSLKSILTTLALSLSLTSSSTAQPTAARSDCPVCIPDATTTDHLEKMLTNYNEIWNGNLDPSFIASTFAPRLVVNADIFPTANGLRPLQIETIDEFAAWVTQSRQGWAEYRFDVHRWGGHGTSVSARWVMHGVIGANFTSVPTTLQPGDEVTYNGTDFLVVNECSGLIEEVYVAQDLLMFFKNLGVPAISLEE